jgi:hypothetical protein
MKNLGLILFLGSVAVCLGLVCYALGAGVARVIQLLAQ